MRKRGGTLTSFLCCHFKSAWNQNVKTMLFPHNLLYETNWYSYVIFKSNLKFNLLKCLLYRQVLRLVVVYDCPSSSFVVKLVKSINRSLVCPLAFVPLLLPGSLSLSAPASWVERALMFQILNYSWNICLASRVCCSLLTNLHLAPEWALSAGLCHLSLEGQFFQFRKKGITGRIRAG